MPYKDPKDPRNIAYKKAYYQRTKDGRYQRYKHSLFKYFKTEKGKEARRASAKKTRDKDIHKSRQRVNLINRRHVKNLEDPYLRSLLKKRHGFTKEDLVDYPEIIETHRLIIKTKRLCRSKTL